MSTAPIIGDNDVNPVIFREYIGVKSYPDSLNNFPADIIGRHIPEFHFILGFAHETYVDGKGTGIFNASWKIPFFSPDNVDVLKNNHRNVKVVISIGGRDTKYPFHPAHKLEWCDNAVESLKKIFQLYNRTNSCYNLIDGIDINYEYIHPDVSEEDFSYCIGDVIKRLKKDVGIDVVSIAPSHETQKHYKTLYLARTNDINWVNYQFYIDTLKSKDEFVNLFLNLSDEYGSKKLLAGASTDPADAGKGKLSREDFLEGCVDLHSTQSLRGIFIWNANDSASNPNGKPFSLEKKAQEILNN